MNVRSNGKMTENGSGNDQNGAKIDKNWAQEMARKWPWSCETKVENSDTPIQTVVWNSYTQLGLLTSILNKVP